MLINWACARVVDPEAMAAVDLEEYQLSPRAIEGFEASPRVSE